MGKLMTVAAVLILLGISAAMAQNSKSGSGSSTSNGTGVQSAPVGHKQPRAGDLPQEKNSIDKLDAENAALDKKIKSICRGC